MNYYIDFDNTLYNTPELVQRLLKEIGEIENAKRVLDLYINGTLKNKALSDKLDAIVLNSSDLVYKDALPFLEKLKSKGNSLFMLTYCKYGLKYQSAKVIGSGLSEYFNGLYITAEPKYELDFDYTKGIFIDDNPEDLLGLYSKKPVEVIRLRREGNKYSLKDLENADIKEYKDFTELSVKSEYERID